MKNIELQMARDIVDKVMFYVKETGIPGIKTHVSKVINSPAPRFYITPEVANRHIGRLLGGKEVQLKNINHIEMYKDMIPLVLKYKEKGMPTITAVTYVVDHEPAPRFYISQSHAQNIVYRYFREKRKDDLRNT